jgi:uncharacterized phage protein gp47/JayE
MTLQYRTLTQILQDFQNYFATNNPKVLVQEGTVPNDIINSMGNESNDFYAIQAFVQQSKTLAGCQNLISGSPDAVSLLTSLQSAMGLTATQVQQLVDLTITEFATNFGVTPLAATAATLTLRFYTSSSSNVNIPINTIAMTASLTAIQYQTSIAIVNMPVTGPDPITGLYYIDVPAQAVTPGTASHVSQNTVTVMSPMLPGFAQVTNTTASSGGTDNESNTSILNRCSLSLKGRELDTINGLTLFTKSQIGVQDASTIDNKSPYMTRGVGSQVDIRVLGSNDVVFTDSFTYATALIAQTGGIVLSSQPVSNILSVTVNGVSKVQGTDYELVKDTGGYSGSVKAMDSVNFLTTVNPGDAIVVQYTYDSLMAILQSLLQQPVNDIPNSDILFREAEAVLIDITAHLVVFAGYDLIQVQNNAQTALEAYFSNLLMGAPPKGWIPQSDIATVISQVTGVSYVDITNLSVDPTIGLADIPINPIQYAVLNNLTWT